MSKKFVLVVEDSESASKLYEGLLAPYDCHIEFARNLDEAFKGMKNHPVPYDAYIVDIDLENNEKGLDIIGKGGNTPDSTLILSGHLPEELVEELMSRYRIPRELIMMKPPDKHEFLNIMDRLLNGDESEELNLDIKKEKKKSELLEFVKSFFNKFTITELTILIAILILLPTALTSWSAVKGYKMAKANEKKLVSYCDGRFVNYREGTTVSNRHYVKKDTIVGHNEIIVKVYPEGFMHFIIYDISGKEEPREIWFPSTKYIEDNKLNEEKTFLSILIETWLKVK